MGILQLTTSVSCQTWFARQRFDKRISPMWAACGMSVMLASQGPQSQIELLHGFAFSIHHAACLTGLAVSVYQNEGLLTAAELLPTTERAMHRCRRQISIFRWNGLANGPAAAGERITGAL